MEEILELQCCVCTQIYSDKSAPRNLPCGHCVCTSCLGEIIKICPECPECRRKITAKKADDLNINHPLLRLSRMHAFATLGKAETPEDSTQLTISQPDSGPAESAGTCSAHGYSLFFACLRCDVMVCRDCLVSDHPDQPYGKCMIVSMKEKTRKMKESKLVLLKKLCDDVSEAHRKLGQIKKGSRIALQYWEKRPEEKREQDYEKNLEEAREFHQASQKDFESIEQLKNHFTETNKKVIEATIQKDVDSLMEDVTKRMPELKEYQANDREGELRKILDKFWKGKKWPV